LLLLIRKLVKEVCLGVSTRVVVVVVLLLLLRNLLLLILLLLVGVESGVSWLNKWLLGLLHHLSACWWGGRKLRTGWEILWDLLFKGLGHTRDKVLGECIGAMVVMIDVGTD
jgi:hypothetical protein